MNYTVILIESAVACLIFLIVILITLKTTDKNTPSNVHNYPPDIQEEYFKTHERFEVSYKSKRVILTKSMGIVIFALVFWLFSILAGAKTFLDGFIASLIIMTSIGLFDTFFIDWVLFANIKAFRLEGTEHMDKAYHQKWFHFKGILFPGSLFLIIASSLVGLLIYLTNL